jgi:hypothetical protein
LPTQHRYLVTQDKQLDILRGLAASTSQDQSKQRPKRRVQNAEQHLDDHAGTQQIRAGRGIWAPQVLRGGMGAKARGAALSRLDPQAAPAPLLVVATGSYIGEGFDCPALDALFLTAPIAFKGRLVQYVGRVMRPYPDKTTAEVHDYHDVATGVLASSLSKRASGYTSLGFPDPRRL